ncbi:alpha-E domain-containing protein [Sulfolobus tengchongensis]|uniref:Alpha-E domain-containing protein n=1 Tax=Sulfolobus tengchongensis TaxID=207809 RepID=A0AAX4L2S5_9CREN
MKEDENTIVKSIAYKIYWAGRYLERIENVCRISIFTLKSGLDLKSVAKEYGLEDEKEVINYIRTSFQYLREDIRSFGDEKLMIEANSLGFLIDSDNSDLINYFTQILNGVINLGNSFEKYFVEVRSEMKIRSQEENQPE